MICPTRNVGRMLRHEKSASPTASTCGRGEMRASARDACAESCMETCRDDSRLRVPRSGFGGTIPLSVEAQAEDLVRDRWSQIQDELKRIGITFTPDEVFESPKAAGDIVHIRPNPKTRVGLVAASGIPDLLNGQVVLEVCETYSYEDLKADVSKPLRLLKYSYQFSFMPELLIESKTLWTPAKSHWGDLLLTQRRLYRFDGENENDWNAKDLASRNSHFVHHFHPGAGEYMRLPVQKQPSVLTVGFLFFSRSNMISGSSSQLPIPKY